MTLVTSLLGAFTPFYAAYAGTKAPVEHFTRAPPRSSSARHLGDGGRAGPDGHAFFYPAEGDDAVAYHCKTAAALSAFSRTGLTDIEDVVPLSATRQRRLVDHRTDHPDQRRLHHQAPARAGRRAIMRPSPPS